MATTDGDAKTPLGTNGEEALAGEPLVAATGGGAVVAGDAGFAFFGASPDVLLRTGAGINTGDDGNEMRGGKKEGANREGAS